MARSGNKTRKAAVRDRASQGSGGACDENPDIAVIGGGMAGLTLAVLLARGGRSVLCLDRESPQIRTQAAFDGRTMAITWGSRRILEQAGLWRKIAPYACPIRDIRVFDGESPALLRFESGQAGGETFGWVVEIRHIRAALFDLAAETAGLIHLAPAQVARIGAAEEETPGARVVELADGRRFAARLVVGADGRESFTRKAAGLRTLGWSYRQRAVVCTVAHENPHDNLAVEHFRARGPFALLPMTDSEDGRHRSTAVWVEDAGESPSAAAWDEKTFNAALAVRVPAEYGRAQVSGQRFSWPLGLIQSRRFVSSRLALVGDAAHGIHPVAGQGLNLGLRDVAALADLVVAARGEDPGAADLLRAYEQARRFDAVTMAGAMDALNRLFASDFGPVRAARRAGLRLVEHMPPARRFLMNRLMGRK